MSPNRSHEKFLSFGNNLNLGSPENDKKLYSSWPTATTDQEVADLLTREIAI